MKRNKTSLLAWTSFAIITALALFIVVDTLLNPPAADSLSQDLSFALLAVEFAFIGALITSRRPRNIIGWLMMGPAVMPLLDYLSRAYLEQFPTPPANLTAQLFLAVVVSNVGWLLLIFPLFFTMLLFPDGHPPSPRWRWVLVAGLGMAAFLLLFILIAPVLSLPANSDWQVANPIALFPADIQFPDTAWVAALGVLTLSCATAPFVRYRRAAGLERTQIKWLFYACGLFVVVYVPIGLISDDTNAILATILGALFLPSLMAIPAAIGIAILRYRLYDIDVIIRKTLLYGALTGLLALVYLGSVVLLQGLFEALTGQSSPIIIVISTLLIAALFTPLRRRLQAAIDRRFFRQKYDAQQVLAQFAATARDEVELETLTAELLRVTRETVQPESVTVWLRERQS